MSSVQQEITLELLSDIATSLRNIGRDFFPHTPFTCDVRRKGGDTLADCIVFRIPYPTSRPIQLTLKALADSLSEINQRIFPSLPLRYTVIGGSEASGIEITVKPNAQPVYGHVHKAKLAWLRRSSMAPARR